MVFMYPVRSVGYYKGDDWMTDWISNLLKCVRDVFPRTFIVCPDEGGVRITLGKRVKTLQPGWFIYWPVIQSCRSINIVPQVVDLRPQSTLTSDLQNIAISGGIKYRVNDAKKALLDVEDYDKSVETLALGIICEYATEHTLSALLDFSEFRKIITAGVRGEADGFGLKIMQVYITDIGKTKNIRIMGSGDVYDDEEEV